MNPFAMPRANSWLLDCSPKWPPTWRTACSVWESRDPAMTKCPEEKEFDYVKSRQLQRIPGYAGHCPNVRAQYGNTFGNATKATFLDRENESCYTSQLSSLVRRTHSEPKEVIIPHLKKFITATSFRPNTAHSALRIPYTLTHTGKRRDEVLNFNQDSQLHRDHYHDLTGTVRQLPSFYHRRAATAPARRFSPMPLEETGSQGCKKVVSFVKYTAIPIDQLRHPKYLYKQPTAREKRIRDVYFERR